MTKGKALSVRLSAIAAMVKPGSRIADIGTDHAYLPVELVQCGTAAHALATDIRKGPLKSARQHVGEAGLTGQIDLRLSDGLAGLMPGEADTVIIAGMGGDLIIRILTEGRGALYGVDTLILSPHTKIPQVRGMLPSLGYAVDCEDMVCDAGKYYVIIRAVRADLAGAVCESREDSACATPPAAACAYCGEYLLTQKNPVLYDWLRREEDTQERILSGLREKSASAAREREINENLITIRQALSYFADEAKDFTMKDSASKTYNSKTYNMKDKESVRALRRSLTFLLDAAAYAAYPQDIIRLQHSIGNGYYFEIFRGGERIPADRQYLETVSAQMRRIAAEDMPIEKKYADHETALSFCRRLDLRDKERILRYQLGRTHPYYVLNGYVDYFYGPLLASAGGLTTYELQLYKNGFVMLFPTVEPDRIEPFQIHDKLFEIMDESAHWGEMLGIRTIGALNEQIAQGRAQEIILVQEALMEMKIGEIAEEIAAKPGCKFILVAGPSSSGKTTFSRRLSVQLMAHGMKPHPISLDDFYVNREDTPRDESGEYDYEAFEALDTNLLNEIMSALLSGEEAALPTFNFKTGHREFNGEKIRLGAEDVLVMEGIHALNGRLLERIPQEAKFKIYISALTQLNMDEHNRISTTDARLIRRMVRDARTRNTSAAATLARWDSVRRGEERNIFPYQEEADIMFNSALIYEMPVLKSYAEPLLYQIDSSSPDYPTAERLLHMLHFCLPVPSDAVGDNSILREFIGGGLFQI